MQIVDKEKKVLNIKNRFRELGFNDKQIEKMFNERQQTKENMIPFSFVNIEERYHIFKNIFLSNGINETDARVALSDGIFFSYLPSTLVDLLDFVKKQGFSSQVFLKMLATTVHGRSVLSWGPKKIKTNIIETTAKIQSYHLGVKDWFEMAIKYPNILKMSADGVVKKIEKWIDFGSKYGFSQKTMILSLQKTPDLLVKDLETLEKKCKVMSDFILQYGVKSNEWIEACIKHPKLLCKDTNALQQNISIYQDYFKKGVFCFSQYPNADAEHLMRYLMVSPQYIIISPNNVKERMMYAEKLWKKGLRPTTAVLYLTKARMQKYLKDIESTK